jgi:uncharacterized protein YaiE (UPF0345 family)
MSTYLGDFRTGKVVRKMWNSFAVAGESITRAANGTVSVYKDGGTTQSTAGVTDTEDFDGLTGVHLVAIDMTADGTFYSSGSDFEVVLSASTIDGKVINATLFSFSIENRSALMPTVADRKVDVETTGEVGLDFNNVKQATGSTTLTNITVPTVTNLTNLPAAPTDWLTAAAVKADAVTKIQAGLSTYAGGDTSGTTTLLARLTATSPHSPPILQPCSSRPAA